MSGKWYGVEMSDDHEEEMKQIQALAEEGTPSIIVEDIDDIDQFGGDADDVIMVTRDDD